jgi:DNA-binding Xre family transcriptional regulator
MPQNSVRATDDGIEGVKQAMRSQGLKSANLAEKTSTTDRTINNFLNGERIKRDTVKEICNLLELEFADIVSEDNPVYLWKELNEYAKDGEKIVGYKIAKDPKMGAASDWTSLEHDGSQFASQIRSGATGKLGFNPPQEKGYALVLEYDDKGKKIYCLCPSIAGSKNEVGNGGLELPQPTSPKKQFTFKTPGRNSLWAAVFPTLPDWEWLTDTQSKMLALSPEHLQDILQASGKNSIRGWKSAYTVL